MEPGAPARAFWLNRRVDGGHWKERTQGPLCDRHRMSMPEATIKPTFRLPLCRSRFIIRAMFSKLLQLELTLLNPLLA